MLQTEYDSFIAESLDCMTQHGNHKCFLQTVTFKPIDFKKEESFIDHCFITHQTLYKHICSKLIRNYTRQSKRHLQPISYDLIDASGSKHIKVTRIETVPHVHSIVFVDNQLADKYALILKNDIPQDISAMSNYRNRNQTQSSFNRLLSFVATADLREIPHEDLESTLRYSSKLLTHPISNHHSLFSMNPDKRKHSNDNQSLHITT